MVWECNSYPSNITWAHEKSDSMCQNAKVTLQMSPENKRLAYHGMRMLNLPFKCHPSTYIINDVMHDWLCYALLMWSCIINDSIIINKLGIINQSLIINESSIINEKVNVFLFWNFKLRNLIFWLQLDELYRLEGSHFKNKTFLVLQALFLEVFKFPDTI